MLKKIILCFLLIFVTGCEQDFLDHQSKSNTKTTVSHQFKWVEINKSTIQTEINKSFKQAHPYPKEINEDINKLKNRESLIRTKINKINQENTQKCIAIASENIDGKHEKKTINIYKNVAYSECLKNIRKDDLLVDLKEQEIKIKQIYRARSDYDRMIGKQVNDTVELAIPKYAEKNGYQLIVNERFSVIYNQDKIVLNVTDDVIDYILKHNEK